MKKKINIPTPTINQVEEYLEQWKSLENYVAQEECLQKLFTEVYPNNTDLNEILSKVSILNDFYSTMIFSPYSIAKHIVENIPNFDKRLNSGDENLVNDLSKVKISGSEKNFFSFATKYCSHHKPKDYPIYDRYVLAVLEYFQKKDNYYKLEEVKYKELKQNKLKDYPRYKEMIIAFQKYYKLEEYCFKDIDRYLWLLGKEHFFVRKKNKANS